MQNMIEILNDRTSLKGNIIKKLNLLIAVLKSFDISKIRKFYGQRFPIIEEYKIGSEILTCLKSMN